MRHDPSHARQPDAAGFAERGDVRLAYEVYGDGPTTVLLMPTWSILYSRFWKAQIPYLSRHHRVVTFDGRGSGRSSSPRGAAAYANAEFAADTAAVMDATGTASAVLVALSCAAAWSVQLAARHPDRISGIVAIGPSCGLAIHRPERLLYPWDERLDTTEGWATYNKHNWLEGDFDAFQRFFFQQMYSEPHSTKQIEDCLEWSAAISAQTLADTTDGRLGLAGAACEPIEVFCADVRCPVLVVHGVEDRIATHEAGARLAELTGGSLVLLEGSGHGPHARDPVKVNLLIREFVDQVSPQPPQRRTWLRALNRPKRALFISSPIGLGHARRDMAIAGELRMRHPDVQIDWLTQPPLTAVLQAAGEHVHPASAWLASEVAHIDHQADEHDLHAFQAIRRMDAILVNNFMVFDELASDQHYDLVIGDEAWDVDYFLHENPERKRFPFAWMTDFVGWLPMPGGGDHEAALTADYNAEMIEQRARFPTLRDRSIFIGDPEDVVDDTFGAGLPGIREWTEANFEFAGYVTGFEVPGSAANQALRTMLGYRPEHKVCVVTVGGSGVGEALLHRVLDAAPLARRLLPELRFLVVTGPRIDPASLPRRRGVRIRGYLPRLHEHLAACDIAVVQGGLTTCMELTASRTPFIYVPLQNHFEQNFHVRHRLERYNAGRHMSYADAADPALLAEAIVKEVAVEARPRPVQGGGAARAAAMLASLL